MANESPILWSESPGWPPLYSWMMAALILLPVALFGGIWLITPSYPGRYAAQSDAILFSGMIGTPLFTLPIFLIAYWLNGKVQYRIHADGRVVSSGVMSETSFEIKPTTRFSVTKSKVLGNTITFDTETRTSFAMIKDPSQVAELLNKLIAESAKKNSGR